MSERYVVYRQSPYPWESQFADTPSRAMIAPIYSSDDQNACIFAAALWATWFGETAYVWDSRESAWITRRDGLVTSRAISPMGAA